MSQTELQILTGIYRAGATSLSALLSTTDFQRGKAAGLLKQVEDITRRMNGRAVRWATAATRDLYRQGLAATGEQLAALGVDLGSGAKTDFAQFNKINERAVGVFGSQLARDLASAGNQAGQRASRVIATTQQRVLADPDLSKLIAKGLISGGSVDKIGRDLRGALTDAGKQALDEGRISATELEDMGRVRGGLITAGKRTMPIVGYCKMVASYQLRQAVTEATRNRMAEAGELFGNGDPASFDLVTVTGPISGDFCDFYVGKIYSLSGTDSEYPALSSIPSGGPPFHPNCTHNIAPFIRQFATARDLERGRINDSLLGIDGAAAQRMYGGIDRRLAARRAESPPGGRSSVAEPH